MANPHFENQPLRAGKDNPNKWFREFPIGNHPDYIYFHDDFTAVALDETNAWTVVEDGTATSAILADTVGGWLNLTSPATDNTGSSVQGNEIFLPAAGKHIWFETRVQLSDTDDMDFYAGLTVNFATNPEAVLTAANRIGFQINEANASILCKTESGGTETSTDSGEDAVDATAVKLGFHVEGTSKVEFFVDRVLVATHTTNIPTTEMAPAAFMLTGAAAIKSLYVDYITVVASR